MNTLADVCRDMGILSGDTVYLTSDFSRVPNPNSLSKHDFLTEQLNYILNLLGPQGTVAVPSASLNLCNTSQPFDILLTPSYQMGLFSECFRKLKGSSRSFHPFWSVSAFGNNSKYVTENTSRHAFGYNSPWTRLLDLDATNLHIGVHPKKSFSLIHHIELVVGVPYRYTKEFIHPVVRNGGISQEKFYLFSCYKGADIVRDDNEAIFKNFMEKGDIKRMPFGRTEVWAYKARDFYDITRLYLSENLYGWLKREPSCKPYCE